MNPNQLLSRNQIFFLFVGFVLVYLVGQFVPLMENDSAQHATMAMRMANSGNFLEIYKGDNPYLDKPSFSTSSAACIASFIILPKETKVTSLPSFLISAFPIGR